MDLVFRIVDFSSLVSSCQNADSHSKLRFPVNPIGDNTLNTLRNRIVEGICSTRQFQKVRSGTDESRFGTVVSGSTSTGSLR